MALPRFIQEADDFFGGAGDAVISVMMILIAVALIALALSDAKALKAVALAWVIAP